ncbi:MAG: hypothetical protein ACI9W4_000678 [Rhodothermales bacterium]|jgi:hypothetical protein
MVSTRQAHLRKKVGLLRDWFSRPTTAAPLACFRVVFGAIMVWEMYRYWSKGWIDAYYVDPLLYFSYPGFSWVSPGRIPGCMSTLRYWRFSPVLSRSD